MSSLVPCPSCARHIRSNEVRCPFCTNALPSGLAARAVPPAPRRLERLAAFTFAASLAMTACGGKSADPIGSGSDQVVGDKGKEEDENGRKDNGKDNGTDDGDKDDGDYDCCAAAMYGMPPAPEDRDAGAAAMYGMPPPPADDGGAAAMYGMPPSP